MLANLRTFDRVVPGWSGRPRFLSGLYISLPLRYSLLLAGALLAGSAAQAQSPSASPNDDPSYRKEFVYGLNFNTRAGLIGGLSVRSTHVLSENWSRYWSIEAVEVKHPKERRLASYNGSSFISDKVNYMYVLRPSIGAQRVIFRKAPESGVQVNALFGAGPSIALMMPYYVYYDYTQRDPTSGRPIGNEDIRAEAYNPDVNTDINRIIDRAPLFSGISEIKPRVGAHFRGALSFEYGRYRDAVAGIETGFLLEYYATRPDILRLRGVSDGVINKRFLPSVYLTIYLGSRS